MSSPAIIGVSLPSERLAEFCTWIIADQRDLEIDDPFYSNMLDNDLSDLSHTIQQQLTGYHGRLGIHGPTEALPVFCEDSRIIAVVQQRLIQALEFARGIRATQMVLHSPFSGFGHPQSVHSFGMGLSNEIKIVHQVLDPIIAQAESQGIQIVLEVCSDVHTRPLLELVRSFDSPQLRLSIDVGHAHIMQQFGGPTPDQWIHDGHDLLAHLHIQDTDGHFDHHWATGDGTICWHAVYHALNRYNITPRMILEVSPHDVLRSHAYLLQKGFVR